MCLQVLLHLLLRMSLPKIVHTTLSRLQLEQPMQVVWLCHLA